MARFLDSNVFLESRSVSYYLTGYNFIPHVDWSNVETAGLYNRILKRNYDCYN